MALLCKILPVVMTMLVLVKYLLFCQVCLRVVHKCGIMIIIIKSAIFIE